MEKTVNTKYLTEVTYTSTTTAYHFRHLTFNITHASNETVSAFIANGIGIIADAGIKVDRETASAAIAKLTEAANTIASNLYVVMEQYNNAIKFGKYDGAEHGQFLREMARSAFSTCTGFVKSALASADETYQQLCTASNCEMASETPYTDMWNGVIKDLAAELDEIDTEAYLVAAGWAKV